MLGPKQGQTEIRSPYRVGFSEARKGTSPKFESIHDREALGVVVWLRA